MPLPESFKFDVRVRERLSRRGELQEADLEKHLSSLPDVAANAAEVELKQPALQTEAERAENSVIVRPAAPRPVSVAPTPIEDLDDDEDEEEIKPVRAVSAPVARKIEAVEPAVVDDDEEDDDDDDDDVVAEEAAEAPKKEEPAGGSEET